VHMNMMHSEEGEEGANAAIFSEAFYQISLVLAGSLAIRSQIWASAQRGVSLKNSELELAALYRILGGLCDAVVMLDDSLQLTEDSAALSTLFLRGCASSTDLAGNDFVSYFRDQDRDHVRQRLSSATTYAGQPALALNASLQDSVGN
ncbi:EIF4E2, partial [Symbiodinium sp. CCMP2456]